MKAFPIKSDDIGFTKSALAYGWFGNMCSGYPVTWEGFTYPTTEHLFQALRYPADSDFREKIAQIKNPMQAKMFAKKEENMVHMVVEPRSEQDYQNMVICINQKIEQNKQLINMLLETADRTIIEDVSNRARKDTYWGAYKEGEQWIGNNHLGEIWMNERNKLV